MDNNLLYHRNLNSNGQAFPFINGVGNSKEQGDIIVNNINEKSKGIGITPSAVIGGMISGAIVNGVLTNNYIRSEDNRRMAEATRAKKEGPNVEGNYYKQVQNVASNLDVIFTPMSAVLTVKNGKKTFTLDTIEVSEMNNVMKQAWSSRNADYFKGLLVSKMYSEMQIAEEAFTKKFIENHYKMKGSIEKKSYDTSAIAELNGIECIEFFEKVASFYDDSDIKHKIAKANIKDVESSCNEFNIDLELSRPFDKYAGVIKNIKSCIGLGSDTSHNEMKSHLENPRYLLKNIQVGFFPDRVIYTLDNTLVNTLSVLSMNQDGYKNFVEGNEKYFKNLFIEQAKESLSNNKEKMSKIASEIEAENQQVNGVDCLINTGTHPVIIYLFLMEHYGLEWLKFDIAIIDEILKREFSITEIADSCLNKIMTIMVANQSDNIYTNSYAFEKAVLSLCSKPVNFMEQEKDNITIQNVVFAIDVLDRVTMHDDIYDNFSPEVVDYITDIFVNTDMYIYSPSNIVSSPLEPQFKEIINEILLKKIKRKMTLDSEDPIISDEIENDCEYIADNAHAVLNAIRRYDDNNTLRGLNIKDLINSIMMKKSIRHSMSKIVGRQALTSLALDTALEMFNNDFSNQMLTYNIKGGN